MIFNDVMIIDHILYMYLRLTNEGICSTMLHSIFGGPQQQNIGVIVVPILIYYRHTIMFLYNSVCSIRTIQPIYYMHIYTKIMYVHLCIESQVGTLVSGIII